MAAASPEIILLPGFMGVHLVNAAGARVWLDPVALLEGDIAEALLLDEDSAESASQPIRAEALIQPIYSAAVQAWTDAGLTVHQFPFDFRLSLLSLGRALRAFIDERAQRAPGTRFALVGHSMGALVAAIYACYDPAFEERIDRSILLGGPLGGTFDSLEAVLGSHFMLSRLVSLTRRDDPREMQRTLISWPGLHGMLPDPTMPLFTRAERLFSAASWPSGLEPPQRWLDESRAMKEVIRSSPLFRRHAAQLLSVGYGTVREFVVGQSGLIAAGPRVAKGDGTVVAQTAIPPGVAAYKADFPHSLLPLDPKVITAVVDLLRTGKTALPELQPADIEGEFRGEETPIEQMLEGVAKGLAGDLESFVIRLFSRI